MKCFHFGLIGAMCLAGGLQKARAITIEELSASPAETVVIHCSSGDLSGTFIVDAGILKLNVDGVLMDGICIDPFHFSEGTMPGYQAVPLTSAPKGNFMSATAATEIERLWASYYSPTMSGQTAAGLQIAIWELTGGSC